MTSIPTDVIPDAPRKRTRATPEQLNILEKTFTVNPSPNSRIREQLSHELGMSERSIQIWFQNRRAKVKNVAKKSSILHNETLRMQYYASTAAAAACQAAMYNQQQKNGVKDDENQLLDPVKTNPDLYYYYYYYYFNQQQVSNSKYYNHPYAQHVPYSSVPPPISLKSLPPPPPPPPTTTTSTQLDSPKWSKKQLHQQRARAHTTGPYYPSTSSVDYLFTNNTQFNRGTSVDFYSKPQDTSFVISPNQLTLSEPYQPSFFDPQQWTNLPFYQELGQKISAESLQIGTWKRMTFEPNDLSCQYDGDKQMFSWCIQDGVSKFKMDIPQTLVQSLKLNTLPSRPGWARLELELKPESNISFYMYHQQGWVQCRDFTEDKQATVVLLHQLDGPALALKAELDALNQVVQGQYICNI